ncbi:MAG TPA: Uma2 family endonuclease [Ktedonobacteraceae bacterium]|jgi:Uma2 family endonuclease|nr:Uma2 family endonuclease [Ktedonobacteraceae bacterium]
MALPESRWVSVEEYLAIDNSSDVRFEYIDGQIRMLAGGSRNHSLIAHNLHGLLHSHLRGTPCMTYTSDMRVQVAADRYYYPDVTVSCDENEAENALANPRVIFEVLSPGTQIIDRTEKLEAYRELLSLEDYVLVSSERQAVEVHHRDRKQNYWITRIYGSGDTVRIESLNAEFLMDEIYERVRFPW